MTFSELLGPTTMRYMWDQRDEVRAQLCRTHVQDGAPVSQADRYASPFLMSIGMCGVGDKAFWEVIRAGQIVELSKSDYIRRIPGKKPDTADPSALRRMGLLLVWKKWERMKWVRVGEDERAIIEAAPTLAAAMQALTGFDKHRFPASFYANDTTSFDDHAWAVFNHWGNTEYRFHAIAAGGWDWSQEPQVMRNRKPVYGDHGIQYIPAWEPPKVVRPATPGANKLVDITPPEIKPHLAKLAELKETTRRCQAHLDNLRTHQARCEGLARTFEAFRDVFAPRLSSEKTSSAAAIARRLTALGDDEVFEKAPELFVAPPAFDFGGLFRPTRPDAPPFETGLEATEAILQLLTEDARFAHELQRWARAALARGLEPGEGFLAAVSDALTDVPMVDDALADKFAARMLALLEAAPPERATRPSEIADGQNPLLTALQWMGTRLGPWAKHARPGVGGIVGIANAWAYVKAHRLRREVALRPSLKVVQDHLFGKVLPRLFGEAEAAKLKAAVYSDNADEFAKYIQTEFRTVKGAFGERFGTPPRPAGYWQSGASWLGVMTLLQAVATFHALYTAERLTGDGKTNVTLVKNIVGSAQTVTMALDTLEKAKVFTFSTNASRLLQQANIVVSATSSVIGMSLGLYEAYEAFEAGRHPLAVIKLLKGMSNGVILYVMFVPHPVVHAAAVCVLVVLEVVDQLASAPREVLNQGVVNQQVRGLVDLLLRDPLSAFLTDGERAALDDLRRSVDDVEVVYRWANAPVVVRADLRTDVQRLRGVGYDLVGIQNMLKQVLTAEDLA